MSKRKSKKNKIDIAYSDLRVYKDYSRPVVFQDKKKKEQSRKRKHKKNWEVYILSR